MLLGLMFLVGMTMTKQLELTKGQFALVDEEDYERLSQFSWHVVQKRPGGKFYAGRSIRVDGKRKNIRLHHEVYGSTIMLDHINGDGLDNRKSNLRPCNNTQNKQNVKKQRGSSSSIYKGVSLRKGKWRVTIKANGKHTELGSYNCEIEAAKVYDKAALLYFKEFACLNFEGEY